MRFDDLDLIALCIFLFVGTIGLVAVIVAHEHKQKKRGLPEPQSDTRDWHGAFMKDAKR